MVRFAGGVGCDDAYTLPNSAFGRVTRFKSPILTFEILEVDFEVNCANGFSAAGGGAALLILIFGFGLNSSF